MKRLDKLLISSDVVP